MDDDRLFWTEVTTGRRIIAHGPVLDPMTAWQAATLARLLLDAAAGVGPYRPCESCGAPMLMARTESGASTPLDIGDHPKGNQAAWREDGITRVRPAPDLDAPLNEGEHRVMTHFATCPRAADHRKRRPPSA
jgi:hypothetical protein